MAENKVELIGLKQVLQALEGLPKRILGGSLRSAIRKGANITRKKMIGNAPSRTGQLKKSIGIKPDKKSYDGLIVGVVSKRKGWYGRFLERGTKRRVTKAGRYKGMVKKQPFIEPAIDSTSNKVIDEINNKAGESVSNYLRKKIKRLNR